MYCPFCGVEADIIKYPKLDYPACQKCMIRQISVNYAIYEKLMMEFDPNFERTEEFVRDAIEKITGYSDKPIQNPSKRGRKAKTSVDTSKDE